MKMLQTPVASVFDTKIKKAVNFIGQFKGVVVALSAGVDSSLVAKLAHKALGERAVAATRPKFRQKTREIARILAGPGGI